MILKQIAESRPRVEIQYSRGVSGNGNPRARQVMDSVFMPADAEWRGLGIIPGSGLRLRNEFADFDAGARFEIPPVKSVEPPGCCCGEILRGIQEPAGCPLFKKGCTPSSPVGPCMVSSEGTCAAHFKYGE
jgi:hydrogenase expression/formation protein HypD